MVDGFDFHVRKESVPVEQHCAPSMMGHVEPTREKLVVNILDRFLLCDDMPLACDLLLDGAFSSTSESWVPVVDAEPFLYK